MTATTLHQDISKRVRSLMGAREITGSELARRLGWSQSKTSRRIRGAVAWRASELHLIARELGVDFAALIPEPWQS